MKLYFENANELNEGLGYMANDLGFELVPCIQMLGHPWHVFKK